jgi:hypothetical protein
MIDSTAQTPIKHRHELKGERSLVPMENIHKRYQTSELLHNQKENI